MTRTNPLAPAPIIVATPIDRVHPAALGRVPSIPSVLVASSEKPPAPSASVAASENSGKDPVPLRSPQTRPKVRLEKDNPWP
jgi:hypothetical protein